MNFPKRAPGQASGAGRIQTLQGGRTSQRGGTGPGETTGTVLRLHVITVAKVPTKPERSAKP